MDHLMSYINKHISQFGVLMVYTTLGEYFQTLYSEHEPVQVRDHCDFLHVFFRYEPLGVEVSILCQGVKKMPPNAVSSPALSLEPTRGTGGDMGAACPTQPTRCQPGPSMLNLSPGPPPAWVHCLSVPSLQCSLWECSPPTLSSWKVLIAL